MGVIVLLAVSVSLDALGIGMSYGASGIRIPWTTKLVIAVLNGGLTLAAVVVGMKLGGIIPDIWFQAGGGVVLLILGGRTIWNALGENKTADYDRDASHVLEPWEGVALGFTLTLDSVSAGFGITGVGKAAYLFPVFTACAAVLFLTAGSRILCSLRRVNGIGGLILIILGLFRIFFGG